VFKLTPPTKKGGRWTETVLHRFYEKTSDGGGPAAGVVFDAHGNLDGTTVGGGGGYGEGTIFQVRPSADGSWKEHVLYSFQGQNDGSIPQGGVVLDAKGNIYGTSEGGMVFRLHPSGGSWVFAVIYHFEKSPDGWHPTGPLMFDTAGSLLGTTEWGGTGQSCQGGCGTAYEVAP
jgi:hypothetical protein